MDVVISLDGTGPCIEYIRHGANWNHVSKNVERMQATMPVDAISVNVVVQFVNVAVIEKWIEYFLQFQVDNIDISPVLGSKSDICINANDSEFCVGIYSGVAS